MNTTTKKQVKFRGESQAGNTETSKTPQTATQRQFKQVLPLHLFECAAADVVVGQGGPERAHHVREAAQTSPDHTVDLRAGGRCTGRDRGNVHVSE
jgi:hypothetical protein